MKAIYGALVPQGELNAIDELNRLRRAERERASREIAPAAGSLAVMSAEGTDQSAEESSGMAREADSEPASSDN